MNKGTRNVSMLVGSFVFTLRKHEIEMDTLFGQLNIGSC